MCVCACSGVCFGARVCPRGYACDFAASIRPPFVCKHTLIEYAYHPHADFPRLFICTATHRHVSTHTDTRIHNTTRTPGPTYPSTLRRALLCKPIHPPSLAVFSAEWPSMAIAPPPPSAGVRTFSSYWGSTSRPPQRRACAPYMKQGSLSSLRRTSTRR